MVIAKYMITACTIIGENCKHNKWHELRRHCIQMIENDKVVIAAFAF